MRNTKAFFIFLIVLLCVHKSDEWKKIGKAFKRLGKGFEKIGKGIGKGFVGLVKGCCGIYPPVCRLKGEVKRRKKEMSRTMNEIQSMWRKVTSQGTWLKTVNDNNGVIYGHIQRITEQSTEAIKMLDARIIVKLNNATNELKKSIQEHDEAVLQFDIKDIEKELDSTKSDLDENQKDLEVMGKTDFNSRITNDMFGMVKTKQITSLLETNEGKKLKRASHALKYHLTKTKISRRHTYKRLFISTMTRIHPVMRTTQTIMKTVEGITKVFTLFTDHIKDIATCHKQRKQMSAKYRQIRREQSKMERTLRQLKRELSSLQSIRISLIKGVKDSRLMKELYFIEQIAQHSADAILSKEAVTKIRIYKHGIERMRNVDSIPMYQNKLIAGLVNVKHTAECYRRKLSTVQSIYRNCKKGLGTLDQLYIHAVFQYKPLMRRCTQHVGIAYTTKSSVMKLVREKSSKEFFEKNCLVNGAQSVLICVDKHDGQSDSKLASKFNIDLKTVRLMTASCGAPSLSPQKVCKLKQNQLAATTISNIFLLDKSEAQTMYNRC